MSLVNQDLMVHHLDKAYRATYLHKWRRMLDWDPATLAPKLGVSARTINLWEAGSQEIPDARWLLFVLLVEKEAEMRIKADIAAATPGGPSLAVVLGDDRQPIDVVTYDNYAGLVVEGDFGVIASVAVDRQTGKERLHRTHFRVSLNDTIIRAAKQWSAYRDVVVQAHERWAYILHRQLVHNTLRAELKNPGITKLKDDIEAAGHALDAIGPDGSPQEHQRLTKDLERAIQALQNAVAASVD